MYFFFQAEDGIRDIGVTGVQTCALLLHPIRSHTSSNTNYHHPLRQPNRAPKRRSLFSVLHTSRLSPTLSRTNLHPEPNRLIKLPTNPILKPNSTQLLI